MEQSYEICIKDIIDTSYAVSAEKADMLRPILEKAIREKQKTKVSFKGLDVVITAFLNIAIGELYKTFSKEDIEEYIEFTDMSENLSNLLPMVKDRSYKFYRSK